MKKLLTGVIIYAIATLLVNAQDYELIWEENFEGASLNTDVWNIETEWGAWNWGANQEMQQYSEENVEVGVCPEGYPALILTASEDLPDDAHNDAHFASGRINTGGKVTALYGKIEARIKLPVLANGFWPAFWTLGDNIDDIGWPKSGEIDIMEAGHTDGIAAGTQERHVIGANHWDEGGHAYHSSSYTMPADQSLYEYNIFTLEWSPTLTKAFVNGNLVHEMNIEGMSEFTEWEHYIILNLAVGGSFTGITTPGGITAPMPANMYVDWVRIYQRDDEGSYSGPDITGAVPNAGSDQILDGGTTSTTLDGSDSYSIDGVIDSYLWTQYRGPSTANIISPEAAQTNIEELEEGSYVFALTVTDDQDISRTDYVNVSVLGDVGDNIIINGDFSEPWNEHWFLYVADHEGVSANVTTSDGWATVEDISNAGGEGWWVQFGQELNQTQINSINENETYTLSFQAKAEENKDIDVFFGEDEGSYTSLLPDDEATAITLTTEPQSFSFDFEAQRFSAMKLSFEGGLDNTSYSVSNVSISLKDSSTIADHASDASGKISVYPNPVTDRLFIETLNDAKVKTVRIIDHVGREVINTPFTTSGGSIDIKNLNPGAYFMLLEGDKSVYNTTIIKK
ncbi:MAG: family 16 glycosylhydrolase [Bacteroidales bacterium]